VVVHFIDKDRRSTVVLQQKAESAVKRERTAEEHKGGTLEQNHSAHHAVQRTLEHPC
jgi:hypothetical protein